jgi:S1-C subfamily serine protease
VVLVFALMQAGCAANAPASSTSLGSAPPAAPAVAVADRDFLRGVADRAQAIRDDGHVVHTAQLVKQLERASCDASLPAVLDDSARALHPDELYERCVPGVFVLATVGNCPDPNCRFPGHLVIKSTASAFALTADGICASNYHVFEDEGGGDDVQFIVAATSRGVVYPIIEVLAADRRTDAAIFRIDTRGDRLMPIPLRVGAPVGTSVAVISHPEERPYTMTTGTIARRSVMRGPLTGGRGSGGARRNAPAPHPVPPDQPIEPDESERLTPAIEITAEYAIGSSGGPVLDDRGDAVGMVCATNTLYADPEKQKDPQAVVRTCVPAESIVRLVHHAQPKPPEPRAGNE